MVKIDYLIYKRYISSVSLINDSIFRNKIYEIINKYYDNGIWVGDKYSEIYNDKFKEICKEYFNLQNNPKSYPNKFILSLILGLGHNVNILEGVSNNFENLWEHIERSYEWLNDDWDEIEEDKHHKFWNEVDCSCGHTIRTKCFIKSKINETIVIRCGCDCFEKVGFVNPKIKEIKKMRKKALENAICEYGGCEEEWEYEDIKLCEKHFENFKKCKYDNCNRLTQGEDFNKVYYYCYYHKNKNIPTLRQCKFCGVYFNGVFNYAFCRNCLKSQKYNNFFPQKKFIPSKK
jgi:hypothetical protein